MSNTIPQLLSSIFNNLAYLSLFGVIAVTGCSYITITEPSQTENYVVRPKNLVVEHTGCGSIKTFKAWLDKGTASEKDISDSFSYSKDKWISPQYNLPAGSHTLTAQGDKYDSGAAPCYYGRQSDLRQFIVHCTKGAFPVSWDFDVVGNFAYVTNTPEGSISVWDVSDPAIPVKKGSLSNLGTLGSITVDQDYAYVTSSWDDLLIIDVSNPNSLKKVGMLDGRGYPVAKVTGNLAYAVFDRGFFIYDVDPPTAPRVLGYFQPAERLAQDVDVSGNIAYYVNIDGLFIVDVSDPSNPRQLSSIKLHEGYWKNVQVNDGIAYVVSSSKVDGPPGNTVLYVFDVSRADNPQQLATLTIPEKGTHLMDVSGRFVYVSPNNDNNYVRVIDVSNSRLPKDLGMISHFSAGVTDTGKGTHKIEEEYKRLYVATDNSVRIIQLPCLQ
jgi:hypothetical protein